MSDRFVDGCTLAALSCYVGAGAHTVSFGSGLRTAVPAPFWAVPAPVGTAHWRMRAGWWRFLTKLLGPGARALVEGSTERSHPSACRLRAASQCTWPFNAFPEKWSAKCSTLLRILTRIRFSAGAGRQAVLKTAICFGLCASEEKGFACIFPSGSKLVSVYNPTLPVVATCSYACVLRAFLAGIAR